MFGIFFIMSEFQIFKSGEIQPFKNFFSTSYAYVSSQLVENETFFDSGEKVKDIFSPLSSKIADLTQVSIGISERVIKRCPF